MKYPRGRKRRLLLLVDLSYCQTLYQHSFTLFKYQRKQVCHILMHMHTFSWGGVFPLFPFLLHQAFLGILCPVLSRMERKDGLALVSQWSVTSLSWWPRILIFNMAVQGYRNIHGFGIQVFSKSSKQLPLRSSVHSLDDLENVLSSYRWPWLSIWTSVKHFRKRPLGWVQKEETVFIRTPYILRHFAPLHYSENKIRDSASSKTPTTHILCSAL
jgi:hypothetical protein